MSDHYIKKCSECGTTITQCRCPAPHKKVIYEVCNACLKAKVTVGSKKVEGNRSDVATCKNCKFVEQLDNYSWCHRNPPTITSDHDGFPRVDDEDWCGEFKIKETLFPISDQSVVLPPIKDAK